MSQNARPARAGRARPRWFWPVVALAAVVVVVGGAALAVALRGGEVPGLTATPTVTVTAPVPTSTAAPAARPAATALTAALPGTLRQYALAASAPDADLVARGALEGWTDTYAPDAGTTGTVTVQVGQWATPEEAAPVGQALADALTAGATPTRTDAVTVGGQPAGSLVVLAAADGTATAVWWNGTVVVRLTGPASEIDDLYAAYPL